jgi:hypothetical protein
MEPKDTFELDTPEGVLHVVTFPGGKGQIWFEKPEDLSEDKNDLYEAYEAALDAITSLVLAHACAGIDVGSPKYVEGLNVVIEACANYHL